jgi:cystathionine gamma-synthase
MTMPGYLGGEDLYQHVRTSDVQSAETNPGGTTHALARKQQLGFGGMISFGLAGGLEASRRFLSACQIFTLAESLGGVESLIEQPSLMSFFELSTEERLAVGIKDNLIRLSVGLEDPDDLIADLQRALAAR